MRRAIVLVLDGCGVGAAPDAAEFGDGHGPNTIANVWNACGGLTAPNLAHCGFFSAAGIGKTSGRFARLKPLSMGGKDSVTGHWEMMGIVMQSRFPTYPNGFPIALIKEFESRIGCQVIGNRAASGTEIIAELGEQHRESHCPIVYTSADSVFQIACHEEVVPIETLYEYCTTAREMLVEPDNVQRVIARPFVGSESEGFTRTGKRKDYPLIPPPNLLDRFDDTWGIGVVPELFSGMGFRPTVRTQSNADHERAVLEALASDAQFIFANFEDFDMLYGHRNDPKGFGACLETFDDFLGRLSAVLGGGDLLILTADHGNDPTDVSTDHTREFVPACLIGPDLESCALGDIEGYTAIGATVAGHLGIPWDQGISLL